MDENGMPNWDKPFSYRWGWGLLIMGPVDACLGTAVAPDIAIYCLLGVPLGLLALLVARIDRSRFGRRMEAAKFGVDLKWAEKYPSGFNALKKHAGVGPMWGSKRDEILRRWADREIE